MRIRHAVIAAIAAGALTLTAAPAGAQTWSDAQLEVWEVIQAEWQASMEQDETLWDRLFHDDFQGWSAEDPAPRGLDTTREWAEFEQGTTLAFELHPLAIVVTGNTAVAHYLWTDLSEDAAGEREATNGRYTDVLVRDADGWKFLAWAGGAEPDDD